VSLGISILGSTGSIGRSAVQVVRHHPDQLHVVALAAQGRQPDLLIGQARELHPELVAVVDEKAARRVAAELPEVRVVPGEEGLIAAATLRSADRVLAAIVGAAGLAPVHAAVSAGKTVALANKEALVVAGPLLTELAALTRATLLPVDSEHVALHQALRCGSPREVRRLVLTASGGPFLRRDPATWPAIRPEEALRHPTWQMGAKISVDSATLMNKGLELIEASHLFATPAAAIDVVVHPQSIVHSLVEFHDGSWLAQLAVNDMVFPIQYALAWPDRWRNEFPRLALAEIGRLDFEPVDERRFSAVRIARQALAAGASAPAVLNAANEIAVHAFLAGQISFPEIVATVEEVLAAHRPAPLESLAAALEWNRWGREEARTRIAARGR
jgi:1-deoxy-D-xylulose-5-phosphate reductoisomerase